MGPFNLYLILFQRSANQDDTFLICFIIVYVILSHIVPVLATLILTVLVICQFSNNKLQLGKFRNTGSHRYGERNITTAMIAVNLGFIILTVPHIVSFIVAEVNESKSLVLYLTFMDIIFSKHNSFIYAISYRILFLIRDVNYSINLFVYLAFIPKFKTALLGLFTYKCGGNTVKV